MKKSTKYLIGIIIVLVVIVAGYFSFSSSAPGKAKTVTVGIMAPSKQDSAIWDVVKKQAKNKYGLTIKLKEFTDWSQPNKAVANGDVDVNSFQTIDFLKQWDQAHDNSVVSIGKTIIAPLRLYSKKVSSVSAIKDGSTITVANDAVNEARGLNLLQDAGLIKLKSGTNLTTSKDIISNPKNLKIKEVDGNQTARALSSVEASVINGGFASSGKVSLKYSLYKEKLDNSSKSYVNVLAVAKKNKNKQELKDLLKTYQSAVVKKEINRQYGQLIVPAWNLKVVE